MKKLYGKALRSCAVVLFALSATGSAAQVAEAPQMAVREMAALAPHVTTPSEMFENMIAAALAKPNIADRIDALSGFSAVASSVASEIATEINAEYIAALTTIFTEAKGNAALSESLKKMLMNAASTSILSKEQRDGVVVWANSLVAVPALAAVAAPVETADSIMLKAIATLNNEDDDSKRIEGVYKLLQQATGKTFNATVQDEFGKLLIKSFNSTIEAHSYLKQTLHEIAEQKTSLLGQAAIDYVKEKMLPQVDGDHKHDKEADKKVTAKADKTDKKATKATGKGKKKRHGKKDKGKKSLMVDLNKDGQDVRDVNRDGVLSDDEKAAHKAARKASKKGKKGKKHAAAATADATMIDADHDGKPDTAPVARKKKQGRKGNKRKKRAAATVDATMVDADHDEKPDVVAAQADTAKSN